jgi:peptidoglycan/LPS O-acetylase OafA/YrhL
MAAEFTVPAPFETNKPQWLNENDKLPDAPKSTVRVMFKRYLPMALGFLFAIGIEALAFQTRATFGGQRDWVVPTFTPFFAIGGVALGALLARKQVIAATPGITFLVIAVVLTILNIIRAQSTEGHDWGRDIFSILTGVALGAALIALVAAIVWSEARNPTRAPLPEV